MSIKPKTAEGYADAPVDLVRATCLQIAAVLGNLMDDLVVVGGLVPSLIIDQDNLAEGVEAHVGTLDLDVGMSLAIFDEEHYQAITERLRGENFAPETKENGNLILQTWVNREHGKVTIDFLIPPTGGKGERPGSIKHLEIDFGAIVAPGLECAFVDYEIVTLSGTTLKGEQATREVKVCGPGAYVVLKSLAFRGRAENKDAYDLYYLIRNFGGGVEDVAGRFRGLLPSADCDRSLEILREDFIGSADAIGVVRATEFLLGEGERDSVLQAEITGFVGEFLRAVEGD